MKRLDWQCTKMKFSIKDFFIRCAVRDKLVLLNNCLYQGYVQLGDRWGTHVIMIRIKSFFTVCYIKTDKLIWALTLTIKHNFKTLSAFFTGTTNVAQNLIFMQISGSDWFLFERNGNCQTYFKILRCSGVLLAVFQNYAWKVPRDNVASLVMPRIVLGTPLSIYINFPWILFSSDKGLVAIDHCCKVIHLKSLRESWLRLWDTNKSKFCPWNPSVTK